MTIAQFFRINGGTTQLRGVTPDLAFPAVLDAGDFGESSFDNALPWAQIKAADYSPKADMQGLVPGLLAQHQMRVKTDQDLQYLQEDIAEFNLQRKKNEISLQEDERRRERSAQEARLAARKLATDTRKGGPKDAVSGESSPSDKGVASDDGLQANERNLVSELAAEKARKNDKDVLLIEAVHVLADAVGALSSNTNLAARIKQVPALIGQ